MIVKPTVTELLKKAKNRYELVIATSKRARQIAMGDEPLTKVKEESPVTLAANEIAEGKVTIIREGEEMPEATSENKEENKKQEDEKENEKSTDVEEKDEEIKSEKDEETETEKNEE
jgi:DNA-directed RNA polymerase subunit omega